MHININYYIQRQKIIYMYIQTELDPKNENFIDNNFIELFRDPRDGQ